MLSGTMPHCSFVLLVARSPTVIFVLSAVPQLNGVLGIPDKISERITLSDDQPYTIKSLLYPAKYPTGTEYVYSIDAPGHAIKIESREFLFGSRWPNKTSQNGCLGERLQIWDARLPASPIAYGCGADRVDILSYSDVMFIEVVRGAWYGTEDKFQLQLIRVPCGRATPHLCPSDKTNQSCITREQICDGVTNCPEGEDEICSMDCGHHAGITDSRENLRIYGGTPVRPNSWPWQIAPRWILTAAHCISLYVTNRTALLESGSLQHVTITLMPHRCGKVPNATVIAVQKVFLPPQWETPTAESLYFDAALLLLFSDVDLSTVQPICLPRSDMVMHVGDRCYAAGCGRTGNPDGPSELLQLAMTILDIGCGSALCPDTLYAGQNVSGTGKSVCSGDSGGPLACNKNGNDQWTLFGVASFITGECGIAVTGYQAVERLMPFIMDTVYSQDFYGWLPNRTVPRKATIGQEDAIPSATQAEDEKPLPLRVQVSVQSTASKKCGGLLWQRIRIWLLMFLLKPTETL
ncbi:transmembrane protease serine 13-like isoform X2 [Paramacrobiotus metropolitanus]|uniref:transmembrane protease serine 13-like isoform X2 n=1 Tax=Paramacrobiotus metropolitanus TaxID=2943436 RepID=UPI0024455E83|nr:transmembrane protease serine 13-like isoform X2 [Paramacrobiotus metropolitanus]